MDRDMDEDGALGAKQDAGDAEAKRANATALVTTIFILTWLGPFFLFNLEAQGVGVGVVVFVCVCVCGHGKATKSCAQLKREASRRSTHHIDQDQPKKLRSASPTRHPFVWVGL